jgi:hypothetical protein
MPLEVTPPSQQTDGFFRIAFVPSGSNNLSVAILAGPTEKDLTYSFTPSGFNRTYTENAVPDPRLTNIQVLEKPGTFMEHIQVQYVVTDLSAADVAYTALGGGGLGLINGLLSLRYGVANSVAWTIAQKVDSVTFTSGKPRRDPPVANGLQTMTQDLYLSVPTALSAALIA